LAGKDRQVFERGKAFEGEAGFGKARAAAAYLFFGAADFISPVKNAPPLKHGIGRM
jgi:hypothetical protein